MRLCELQRKEVINICDGKCLGNVMDIDMDEHTGCIDAIVVPGPCKVFGLFGHEFEYCIPWKCIVRIGSDIILIEVKECDIKKKI